MSTPPACITTNLLRLVYEIMVYHLQTHSLSSPNPLCFVYETMVYHHQIHSLSSTNSLRIVYKLILYHPLPHGISSTNSSCALSKPSLHCLHPNVHYSFAQGLLLHNTKKRRSKKLLSFTSSSLISISRPTPLMRDYPIIGRSAFIPFYLRGEAVCLS